MADDNPNSSPPPRDRQPQAWRSAASNNWRLKDDSPRAEQPQRGGRGGGGGFGRSNNDSRDSGQDDSASASGTRLYVGNLLYTAQKGDIEALFTEKGFNVVNVSISTDPFSGRNPSYCFVDLDSADEAQRAIAELNGVDVLGRTLRVSPGVARRSQGQGRDGEAREPRARGYERGGFTRDVREERNTDYRPSNDRWASSQGQASLSEGRRLYFGNLPAIESQSALEEEIQTLFATTTDGIAIATISKLISPHASKAGEPGNHHYAFVDLERPEDVDAAIAALDGHEGSWGGALRVNRAREQRERTEGGGRERRGGREGGGGGFGREGGGGGRWRNQE